MTIDSKSLPEGLRLVRLADESEWRAFRPQWEAIEDACGVLPWMSWEYVFHAWSDQTGRPRCWALHSPDRQLLWVLREGAMESRRLRPLALRAFDDTYFMSSPPFLCPRGTEEECGALLAAALPELRRASRADLLFLQRIEAAAGARFAEAVAARGVPSKRSHLSDMCRVEPGADFDAFLAGAHKEYMRDLRRRHRRLGEALGAEPRVLAFDGAEDDAAFEQALDAAIELRRGSWQAEWGRESGRVEFDLEAEHYRRSFRIWRRRGWLRLHLVDVGGRPAAFLASLVQPPLAWCLVTGYDARLRAYGVGMTVFLEGWRSLHAEGARTIELGGEAIGWKERWATSRGESIRIEWPLGGWKGAAWRVVRAARGIRWG